MQFLQLHQVAIKSLLIGFITLNYFLNCYNSSKAGLPHARPSLWYRHQAPTKGADRL